MSGTIPLEDAQATLPELIANLTPGEEIVITQNQQPVARLLRVPSQPQRQLGEGSLGHRGLFLLFGPSMSRILLHRSARASVSARVPCSLL